MSTAAAPIKPQAVLTAATSPTKGNLQPYNASAGALAPVLPALSGVADGAVLTVEKDSADATANAVTVTCAGADTLSSGATTVALVTAGERVELQAATIAATRVWKVLRHTLPRTSMDTRFGRIRPASQYAPMRRAEARALGQDGACRIFVAGDSTAAGWYGTVTGGISQVGDFNLTEFLKSYYAKRGYPIRGTGPVSAYQGNLVDKRITYPTTNPGWGGLGNSSPLLYTFAGTPSAPLLYDFSKTGDVGTIVDVYYANSGGTFTISIDGASSGAGFATQTTTGGSTMGVKTITGLSSAAHTVAVTGSNAQIFAVDQRSTDYGISFWNAGIGGAKTVKDFASTNWFDNLKMACEQWGADAVLLGPTGVNDAGNSGTGDGTGASPATFLTQIQAAYSYVNGRGVSALPITPIPSSVYDVTAYTAAVHTAAQAAGLNVIDLAAAVGSATVANTAGLLYDGVHGKRGYYAAMAQLVDQELHTSLSTVA